MAGTPSDEFTVDITIGDDELAKGATLVDDLASDRLVGSFGTD